MLGKCVRVCVAVRDENRLSRLRQEAHTIRLSLHINILVDLFLVARATMSSKWQRWNSTQYSLIYGRQRHPSPPCHAWRMGLLLPSISAFRGRYCAGIVSPAQNECGEDLRHTSRTCSNHSRRAYTCCSMMSCRTKVM